MHGDYREMSFKGERCLTRHKEFLGKVILYDYKTFKHLTFKMNDYYYFYCSHSFVHGCKCYHITSKYQTLFLLSSTRHFERLGANLCFRSICHVGTKHVILWILAEYIIYFFPFLLQIQRQLVLWSELPKCLSRAPRDRHAGHLSNSLPLPLDSIGRRATCTANLTFTSYTNLDCSLDCKLHLSRLPNLHSV